AARQPSQLDLEGEVVRDRGRARLLGKRSRTPGMEALALEPQNAFLEPLDDQRIAPPLAQLRLEPSKRLEERVDLLEQLVHELQERVVEPSLICGERLDVPLDQSTETPLDRVEDRAAKPGPAFERPCEADDPRPLG